MSSSKPEETDVASDTQPAEEKQKLTLEVKIDKPSACKRHVSVRISREDIERYFREAFDELIPKAEVPGFRPGRAPRKLVESRFKTQIAEQVKGSLLVDAMTQVNEEFEFSAISEPDFDYEAVTMPDEGPLAFEFDVEVRPEFDLPDWKGLALDRPVHDFTDEEVGQELRKELVRYGQVVTVDGPVAADDLLLLNVTFRHQDRLLSEMSGKLVRLRPTLSFRDGQLEGFDQLMSGARAGDRRQAQIKISPDVDDESLRGQEVSAEFEVCEVKRQEVPVLDQELLERIGGFENEDQLRQAIHAALERQLMYQQQRRVRQQITALLTQSADWDLPADLLRRQANRELQRAVMELQSSGFAADQILAHENELRRNSIASTARALKEHFILERIAEAETIDAEPQDYDTEIEMLAEQTGDSPRRVRSRLEKRGQMDVLRNQIVERKVINLITSHAHFRDISFKLDEPTTMAVDHAICGAAGGEAIPEAKPGGEAEELRRPVDHS